jgi:hypothetical protein
MVIQEMVGENEDPVNDPEMCEGVIESKPGGDGVPILPIQR